MIDTYKQIYQKKELPWGREQFYQSCKELNLQGERDTEKRFQDYKLEYLLNNNDTVLDIGSNCGFLSLLISKYVKQIDGVEKEEHLCELANKAKETLNIENCNFYNQDFKQFTQLKKYDVILFLAEHLWINIPFKEYIKKIKSLLKYSGLFLIESHKMNIGIDIDFKDKLKEIEDNGFTKLYQTKIDIGRNERIFAIFRLGNYEIKETKEIANNRLDINITCKAIEELERTGNSEIYKEYHFKRHGWKVDKKNFDDLLNYTKIARENSLLLKPIQLDKNDRLFDGCHRLSACIYTNQKYILTEKLDFISNIKIDKEELFKLHLSKELINKLEE
jgi:16S rRNA G527 N7-methylase RsmG